MKKFEIVIENDGTILTYEVNNDGEVFTNTLRSMEDLNDEILGFLGDHPITEGD